MTPEDVVDSISLMLPCVIGLPTALSQTGESYIVLSSLGEVQEGSVFPLMPTEDSALHGLLGSINDYASRMAAASGYSDLSKMTLYWRVQPETEKAFLYREDSGAWRLPYPHYSPVEMWRSYARLIVTDKPVIFPCLAALEAHHMEKAA